MKSPPEVLEIFDLEGNFIKSQPREEFYDEVLDEFKRTGKIAKKVKTIRVLLMTPDGRIYVQKRSTSKEYNAGLYDKTAGGHFVAGHTWELTLVREMAEELGIPSVVLPEEIFNSAIVSTDLSVIAIFKEIDLDKQFFSERIIKDSSILQPFITKIYIGYYDGSLRFRDGEASGIEIHSIDDLKADMKLNSGKYTQDLKVMLERYEKYLIPADKVQ